MMIVVIILTVIRLTTVCRGALNSNKTNKDNKT